jgi:hypothetical protein
VAGDGGSGSTGPRGRQVAADLEAPDLGATADGRSRGDNRWWILGRQPAEDLGTPDLGEAACG